MMVIDSRAEDVSHQATEVKDYGIEVDFDDLEDDLRDVRID